MNVLFITHSRLDQQVYGDASTRYRCFNIAEVLHSSNHQADVRSLSDIEPSDIQRYDIVSCLRPVYSRKLKQIAIQCHARGIHLVADFDDLIFDPAMAAQSPMVINGFAKASYVQGVFKKHAKAVALFDELTVSTPALFQAAHSQFPEKRINIIRNGLSSYWIQYAQQARTDLPKNMRLGYLSGSRSHDHDLAMIASTLSRNLEQRPEARLSLVGKIGLPTNSLPTQQVDIHPWMDYFKLPSLIGSTNANLAPLVSNAFSYAKSHIKFIESAAMGVPAICSPTSDLIEHQQNGLIIVDQADGWNDAINSVLDPDYRRYHYQSLMDYALEHCSARRYSDITLKAWEMNSYWESSSAVSVA